MALLAAACAKDETIDTDEPAPDPAVFEAAGPNAVSHLSFTLDSSGRSLPVTIWYPAESQGPGSVYEYLIEDGQEEAYRSLLDAAPAGCPVEQTVAGDLPPLAGEWPLVLFSHCHECVRFSMATVAERMASHGFLVAAPDHTGNTLWNKLDGDGEPLGEAFLQTRAADIAALLAELQVDSHVADVTPGPLGMMGHSFGAVTTGLVMGQQPEFEAGLAMAAPMENPLIPGAEIDDIDEPILFLLAEEDNSITELGNVLIRTNHEEAKDSWIVEVPDAGHWSFSDIAGLHADFMPGCGSDTRQTNPAETFDYLDPAAGRDVAAETATAFFSATLLDDPSGLAWLDQRASRE